MVICDEHKIRERSIIMSKIRMSSTKYIRTFIHNDPVARDYKNCKYKISANKNSFIQISSFPLSLQI